ncbi:Ldh family oxidoreductase [Planctomicrobium sp. SH661]|uniref:Ldh family oxidoreductase n=1 Tax=Planctomicrobium sp. SH661 TaxID=3448124 RepID=UPI003F5B0E90
MPILNFEQLISVASSILQGAGVSEDEAAIISSELADANMVGHDSHGVMRLVQYVEFIRDGYARPGARMEVVNEGPNFAVIDGHFNFGQVTARAGLQLGLQKAREQGTATILIRNCNHIGRLGSYTHEAARAGLVAIMAVNAPGPGGVAPFGGIERRLGTNPISIAAPAGNDALVLDMTTSATAEGKLRVAKQKGEMIDEGLVIDGYGNPSCDPNAYYNKPYGSILPLGGALMGHKGFGLSVMIDVICGILSGSGVCRDDLPRGANGVWMQLLEIERFIPRASYDEWMQCYLTSIKGCPRRPGVDEILMPGEIELRRREQRQKSGVDIPAETWRQLQELAASVNVSLEPALAG